MLNEFDYFRALFYGTFADRNLSDPVPPKARSLMLLRCGEVLITDDISEWSPNGHNEFYEDQDVIAVLDIWELFDELVRLRKREEIFAALNEAFTIRK